MNTSLAISAVIIACFAVSTVAFVWIGGSAGETIQLAMVALMMPLLLWMIGKDTITYDADAGTVTLHFKGR